MKISLIAAMGKNRELGAENKLPWHLPDDLKRFKAVTKGHAVIMGRKTYESIGRPLPERQNIIVTRNKDFKAEGCVIVGSIEEAFAKAKEGGKENDEVFVIGGAEIYKLALPYANKMYLTFVDATIPADVYFPEFETSDWKVTQEEPHGADEKHGYSFVFRIFERIKTFRAV